MTDKEIIDKYFHNNNLRCGKIKSMSIDEYNEIFNKYPDSDHIKEVLWRIKRNIKVRPVCAICGARVKWKKATGLTNEDCYYNTCSRKCGNIVGQQRIKENCLANYGCEYHNQRKDVRNKFLQTMIERYGVAYALQNKESLDKLKETNFNRYGVDSYAKSDKFKEEYKNHCLEKFGSTSFWNSPLCKQLFISKYGVDNPMYVEEFRTKISDWWKKHPEHRLSMKQGLQNKYDVSNPMHIPSVVNKIKQGSKEAKIKEFKTKKHNGTLGNKSKQEDKVYKILVNKFINVERQFSSDNYPFNCDFYIPSLDLYIECNFHWTHGGKPYIKDDVNCIKQLEHWKQKSENSQFYRNAIHTWTIRDVNKRQIAFENKLNFKEFYSLSSLENWLNGNYNI